MQETGLKELRKCGDVLLYSISNKKKYEELSTELYFTLSTFIPELFEVLFEKKVIINSETRLELQNSLRELRGIKFNSFQGLNKILDLKNNNAYQTIKKVIGILDIDKNIAGLAELLDDIPDGSEGLENLSEDNWKRVIIDLRETKIPKILELFENAHNYSLEYAVSNLYSAKDVINAIKFLSSNEELNSGHNESFNYDDVYHKNIIVDGKEELDYANIADYITHWADRQLQDFEENNAGEIFQNQQSEMTFINKVREIGINLFLYSVYYQRGCKYEFKDDYKKRYYLANYPYVFINTES